LRIYIDKQNTYNTYLRILFHQIYSGATSKHTYLKHINRRQIVQNMSMTGLKQLSISQTSLPTNIIYIHVTFMLYNYYTTVTCTDGFI